MKTNETFITCEIGKLKIYVEVIDVEYGDKRWYRPRRWNKWLVGRCGGTCWKKNEPFTPIERMVFHMGVGDVDGGGKKFHSLHH